MDNMHNSELFGRTIRCNYAQPPKIKGGDAGFASQPVWADADQYAAERDAEEAERGNQTRRAKGRRRTWIDLIRLITISVRKLNAPSSRDKA